MEAKEPSSPHTSIFVVHDSLQDCPAVHGEKVKQGMSQKKVFDSDYLVRTEALPSVVTTSRKKSHHDRWLH